MINRVKPFEEKNLNVVTKSKMLSTIGLIFFVVSYIMFSQNFLSVRKPIDFTHWFNLIGAVLLISFNNVFPKNKLNSIASVLTSLGVIAHIGLCTIDLILWSFGNDDIGRIALSEQISNTPSILYPFIIVGPSLLFVGLATHALNFIKTNPTSSLMVIIGSPFVGLSFFIWKNGNLMLISCVIFAAGLALLLYRKKINEVVIETE